MARVRSRRENGVLIIELNAHGGARAGAGRKPAGRRPGVAHRRRDDVRHGLPLHISTGIVPELAGVSRRRRYQVVRRALVRGAKRSGFRVCHFSLARSRAHFVVEADGSGELHRGMTGLLVRLARGLNRAGGRRGQVFPDRYRHHVMRCPAEVHRTLAALVRPPPRGPSTTPSFTAVSLLAPAAARLAGCPGADPPPVVDPLTPLLLSAWPSQPASGGDPPV